MDESLLLLSSVGVTRMTADFIEIIVKMVYTISMQLLASYMGFYYIRHWDSAEELGTYWAIAIMYH